VLLLSEISCNFASINFTLYFAYQFCFKLMSLFGRVYKTLTFGESHAKGNLHNKKGVGCIIDGFPSGFKVDLDHIQNELNRRKPGQSSITTPRK
jgi:chorismate synthase